MTNLRYWLAFNNVKGIGAAKTRALLDYFGDLELAWHSDQATLLKIGFDQRTITSFFATRAQIDLDAKMAELDQLGVRMITWDSAEYPKQMLDISAPPPLLYVKGQLTEADYKAIAIVGTRRITTYGRQVSAEISQGLVHNNMTIVSGLARGVDSIAHTAAVENQGRTIAVLGSGIDCIYPPENQKLADKITDGHGAVISEYALGVKPEAKNFPPRNRIISALSLGTVVIEAAERSGALITAKFAREQGREVYAVPGNVMNKQSKGPNKLIQQGATLVTCAEDILDDLQLRHVATRKPIQMMMPDSAEEAALLSFLAAEQQHVDQLSRLSGIPASLVSSTLTLMELKGMVKQVGGMQYVRINENRAEYLG